MLASREFVMMRHYTIGQSKKKDRKHRVYDPFHRCKAPEYAHERHTETADFADKHKKFRPGPYMLQVTEARSGIISFYAGFF